MEGMIGSWLLGAVVLAGAAADWSIRRIPNWLTLPAMAAGLALNAAGGRLGSAAGGMAAALAVYFAFFALGFRGAGDGKLMGAVGAFVGWPQVAVVMALVALAGGAAAVAVALRYGALGRVARSAASIVGDLVCLRWSELRRRSDYRAPGALRLPHGPVIAAGTLAFLLLSPR
jgi:prepilin peptidase CpaA